MTKKQFTNHNKFTKPSFSKHTLLLLTLIFITFTLCFKSQATQSNPKPPPIPILPIPTSPQLSWQITEMSLFFHFGTNTFTNSEWGTGHADPIVFNPTALNATQWVSVAKDTGFSRVVLTTKHHDGFCLWPSEYTDYSVKSSNWRNGSGDVVKELADATRVAGLELGIYLSPWDRHESCYGDTDEYNEFYMGQMTELLTRYGDVREVWLDGAKGEGEKDMEYFFDDWFSLIHQLQPGAVIFSDAGPDIRWVGDENGVAGTTCWSLFNCSDAKIGDTDAGYSGGGDAFGHDWVPAECDVSIRPGWFWHPSEVPKSAMTLLDLYYKSVGRNCLLLLNVPPNSSGLISPEDIQVLQEFSQLRNSIFSNNLAKTALTSASSTRGSLTDSMYSSKNVLEEGIFSYWAPEKSASDWTVYLEFQEAITVNVLLVQEPIQMGQRILKFHLDYLNKDGEWKEAIDGTTVGYKRILLFPSVETSRFRFCVDKSRANPLIAYLGVYMDPFTILGSNLAIPSSKSRNNGSESLELTTHSNLNVSSV